MNAFKKCSTKETKTIIATLSLMTTDFKATLP